MGGIAVIITTASLRQLIDTLPTDPRTVYLFIVLWSELVLPGTSVQRE